MSTKSGISWWACGKCRVSRLYCTKLSVNCRLLHRLPQLTEDSISSTRLQLTAPRLGVEIDEKSPSFPTLHILPCFMYPGIVAGYKNALFGYSVSCGTLGAQLIQTALSPQCYCQTGIRAASCVVYRNSSVTIRHYATLKSSWTTLHQWHCNVTRLVRSHYYLQLLLIPRPQSRWYLGLSNFPYSLVFQLEIVLKSIIGTRYTVFCVQ